MSTKPGYIINHTFDEIQIGDSAEITRAVSATDIEKFAILSGDINPTHLDQEFAEDTIFKQVVAHGMWSGALISCVLGTKLPGPGTIFLGQTLEFLRATKVGDLITAKVTVTEKQDQRRIVILACLWTNQLDEEVIRGVAKVMAPAKKIEWKIKKLPSLVLK